MKKLLLILLCLPMIGFGQGWEILFGGNGDDRGNSVQQTSDGGYIIGWMTNSSGNGLADVYVVKTDDSGNQEWDNTFGGINDDYANCIQQTSDGGFIIIGGTWSFGNGYDDVYLIKIDDNGNEIWNQTFGGVSYDGGFSVQQTLDGGYILAGGTFSIGNGGNDVYLIKTDSNGNELWNQTFGGNGDDRGNSVQQTSDGGYIIGGFNLSSLNGDPDIYLIKTDGNGSINSTFNIPKPNQNKEILKITDVLGREVETKQNIPLFYIYNDGTVEKKIIIQ